MSPTIAQRGPAIRLRTLSIAAIGTVVVATGVAVVPDLLSGDDALPADVGVDVPTRFAVTYRVNATGTTTTDVLRVQRPFGSHLTTYEGDSTDGRVLSERASGLGLLATSSGRAWGRLVVPPALGTADLRPDAALTAAVESGLVEDLGPASVGGRRCRRYATATSIAAGTLESPHSGERAEVCIDAVGIVLAERWEIEGEEVRSKRAVALFFNEHDDDLSVPAGETLTGSGDLRQVADDGPVPFATSATVGAVPDGFDHLGRYAVVPPDLTTSQRNESLPPAGPAVATITDVWVRGADVLIVDQGASTGRDPFPPTDIGAPVDLAAPGLQSAILVLDLRSNEVRVRLADGGFVRVAATLPPDELMAVARSLAFAKGASDG